MVNRASPSCSIVHEVVCHVKPGVTPAEWFSIMSDAGQRLAWIDAGIAFGQQAIIKAARAAKNDHDKDEKILIVSHYNAILALTGVELPNAGRIVLTY